METNRETQQQNSLKREIPGCRYGLAILASLLTLSGPVLAESPHAGKSADEVAKELSNPAGALSSLFNTLKFTSFEGDLPDADNQERWSYEFQPVIPFPVGDKGRNIIFRPLVTVPFDQPAFDASNGDWEDVGVDLADISYQLVYSGNEMKDKHNGYLWGIGINGVLPTATDDRIAGDQWRLGPTLFGGIVKDWGLIGLVAQHTWDVAGSNDDTYSVTSGQYFIAYGLGNGWQFSTNPNFAYNHKADSDNALTFPVGLGLAKTTKIGSTPVKFAGEIQYFVEKPDNFGPEWMFMFKVTPVINNPFLR